MRIIKILIFLIIGINANAQIYPDEIELSDSTFSFLISDTSMVYGHYELEIRNDSLCIEGGDCIIDLTSIVYDTTYLYTKLDSGCITYIIDKGDQIGIGNEECGGLWFSKSDTSGGIYSIGNFTLENDTLFNDVYINLGDGLIYLSGDGSKSQPFEFALDLTLNDGNGIDFTEQQTGIWTAEVDTSVIATQYDITQITETDPIFTGWNYEYDSLINTPTIPTLTSQLTNDSGFLTSHLWGESSGNVHRSTGNVGIGTTTYSNLLSRQGISITNSNPGLAIGTSHTNYWLRYIVSNDLNLFNPSYGLVAQFQYDGDFRVVKLSGSGSDKAALLSADGTFSRSSYQPVAASGTGNSGYLPRWFNDTTQDRCGLYSATAGATQLGLGTTSPNTYLLTSGAQGFAIRGDNPRLSLASSTTLKNYLFYHSGNDLRLWESGDIIEFRDDLDVRIVQNLDVDGNIIVGDNLEGNAVNIGGYDSSNKLTRVSIGNGLTLDSGTLNGLWTKSTQGRIYRNSIESLPYVGIQTTAPTNELHVNGDIRIESGSIIDTDNSGGSIGQFLGKDAGGIHWENLPVDDDQTLSFSDPNLTISGGNSVDISSLRADQHVGRATVTTATTPGTTTWTALGLATVSFEIGDVDVNTSTERITCNSSGYYRISWQGIATGGTNIEGEIRLKRNGISLTEYVDLVNFNSEDTDGLDFNDVIYMTSGQYLEFEFKQSFTGGANDWELTDLYISVERI